MTVKDPPAVGYRRDHGPLIDRVWIGAVMLTVLAIVSFSTVSLNLGFSDGVLAKILAAVYVIALFGVFISPSDARAHTVAMLAGTLFWVGRGYAFAELALNGSTNLWGSVLREAVAGTAAYGALHLKAIEGAARKVFDKRAAARMAAIADAGSVGEAGSADGR